MASSLRAFFGPRTGDKAHADKSDAGRPSLSKAPGEKPAPADGLPAYSRSQVEEGITATRVLLASVVMSDPERARQFKDRLHYLHCYKLAYEVSTSRESDSPAVRQLAVSQYMKQRAMLGGEHR